MSSAIPVGDNVIPANFQQRNNKEQDPPELKPAIMESKAVTREIKGGGSMRDNFVTREEFSAATDNMNTKIDAMEKVSNVRFDAIGGKLDSIEKNMDIRFQGIENKIDLKFDNLLDKTNLSINEAISSERADRKADTQQLTNIVIGGLTLAVAVIGVLVAIL